MRSGQTGAFDSERAMRGLRYQLHAPGEPKARHGNGTSAPRSTVDGTREFVRQTAHMGMRTRQTERRSPCDRETLAGAHNTRMMLTSAPFASEGRLVLGHNDPNLGSRASP